MIGDGVEVGVMLATIAVIKLECIGQTRSDLIAPSHLPDRYLDDRIRCEYVVKPVEAIAIEQMAVKRSKVAYFLSIEELSKLIIHGAALSELFRGRSDAAAREPCQRTTAFIQKHNCSAITREYLCQANHFILEFHNDGSRTL
jgi:hypothetical protein